MQFNRKFVLYFQTILAITKNKLLRPLNISQGFIGCKSLFINFYNYMKNFYFSILFTVTVSTLYAQSPLTQNGFVREFNSGKKAVANVQILFAGAPLTASDSAGKYRLNFADKKAFDFAFRDEIGKKGYELVNEKELEHLRLGVNNAPLNVDIIVAKLGTISNAQKSNYALIESILKSSFDDEKDKLRIALANRQITKQAYYDQYEQVLRLYSALKRDIYRISDKFARTNLDDISSLNREVLTLFNEKQLEKALNKLENSGLIDGFYRYFKELKAIKNPADSARYVANNYKILSNNLSTIELQADLQLLALNKEKAVALYDQIFVFDSTNLDILRGCAEFYKNNNFYEKAMPLYSKIIGHPKADLDQKKQAYFDGADILVALGELEEAANAYVSGKNILFQWLNKDLKNTPFLRNELNSIYFRAGSAYLNSGNTDKAMVFFKNFNRSQQELLGFYPQNLLFKKGLANSFERFGKIHVNIGDLASAAAFYEKNRQLREEIYDADRTNLEAKDHLAMAYEKLGNTQMSIKMSEKALANYDKYFALKSDIFVDDVVNIDTKNNLAIAYLKLGTTYSVLNDFNKALIAFTDYNRLMKELLNDCQNNPEFKNGLAMSFTKIAETHLSLENPQKALMYYEERLKLSRELSETFPKNVSYKNNLSVIYSKIGNIYTSMGDVDLALAYYMKDADISKELVATFPKNEHFKNSLAITYSKLGSFYKDKKSDTNQAHIYLEKSKNILAELTSNAPNSVDYKNNLKWVEDKLTEK